MPSFYRSSLGSAAVAAAALSFTLTSAAPAGAQPAPRPGQLSVSVVDRGLDVPKYLAFGPGGLYVAESGTGGSDCINAVGVTGKPTQVCAGRTGDVVLVDSSHATRTVLGGLASTVEKDNHEVLGPASVTFDHGRLVVLQRDTLVGAAGSSAAPGLAGRSFGKLLLSQSSATRPPRPLADIAAFQSTHPQPASTLGGLPGETTWDSDPHDVTRYKGGWAVVDAGANDVVWAHHDGHVSLLGRLPTQTETAPAGTLGAGSPAMRIQAQAVPSSITTGPDGALYVGVLRGFPSLPGTAQVYRLTPGAPPQVAVSGLSRVSDLAFDHGSLLILESNRLGGPTSPTSPGALLRADPTGDTTVHATPLGVAGLVDPTGLAVGPDGAAYITNNTASPGHGEVLRVSGLR